MLLLSCCNIARYLAYPNPSVCLFVHLSACAHNECLVLSCHVPYFSLFSLLGDFWGNEYVNAASNLLHVYLMNCLSSSSRYSLCLLCLLLDAHTIGLIYCGFHTIASYCSLFALLDFIVNIFCWKDLWSSISTYTSVCLCFCPVILVLSRKGRSIFVLPSLQADWCCLTTRFCALHAVVCVICQVGMPTFFNLCGW